HILHEVELIATRMVIISKGKAVAEGSVSDLLHADDLVVRFDFPDISLATQVLKSSGWSGKVEKYNADHITFRLNRVEVSDLNNWLCAHGVDVNGISALRKLEDYFMKLTG
ncbi:MAG: ABC transporter ATP-binding protein, partial [Bacteroidota bacterium]